MAACAFYAVGQRREVKFWPGVDEDGHGKAAIAAAIGIHNAMSGAFEEAITQGLKHVACVDDDLAGEGLYGEPLAVASEEF